MPIVASLGLLALLAHPALAADTLSIPVGQQGAGLSLPQHGESRAQVLETHGLPAREHPPVGQPPITRWDYAPFSVYFEYDHVVSSVANPRPQDFEGARP